jgi:hypothetical protein
VPVLRYLSEVLGIPAALRQVAGMPDRRRTFAVHHVLFVFLAGALTGVHRLAHLEWLRDDAVLLKLLRLPRWPVRKVLSRALAGIDAAGVAALQDRVAQVGLAPLAGRASAVVDLDSSAIVSFGNHEGTAFGDAGKGRRRVHDPKAPPQGERIAHCTRWRYQALVTSHDSEPPDCWRFTNDRSSDKGLYVRYPPWASDYEGEPQPTSSSRHPSDLRASRCGWAAGETDRPTNRQCRRYARGRMADSHHRCLLIATQPMDAILSLIRFGGPV